MTPVEGEAMGTTDRFGVVGAGRQRLGVAGTQRPLEDVQQGFTVLTHLEAQTGTVKVTETFRNATQTD